MASFQIPCDKCKEYYLWMRGHHAYKDIFEPVIGTTLSLQREPENARYQHAVATVEDSGGIVCHIPFRLLRIVSSFSTRSNYKAMAKICGKCINQGAGLGLEIPVIYTIHGGKKYLERLDELFYSSETAKRALREKEEGILVEGQKKKRKFSQKDKGVDKRRKNDT